MNEVNASVLMMWRCSVSMDLSAHELLIERAHTTGTLRALAFIDNCASVNSSELMFGVMRPVSKGLMTISAGGALLAVTGTSRGFYT